MFFHDFRTHSGEYFLFCSKSSHVYFCDFKFGSYEYFIQIFVLTMYSTISCIKSSSSYILSLIFQDQDTFTTTIYH